MPIGRTSFLFAATVAVAITLTGCIAMPPTISTVPPVAPAVAQPSQPSAAPVPVAPVATPVPVAPVAPPAPVTPSITIAQENAIESAESYLNFMGFSRSGLIGQLEYEGYSTADATFAVDSLNVDWNEQAGIVAQNYLEFMSFSAQGLYDQLIFEGFTDAEASAGLAAVGY